MTSAWFSSPAALTPGAVLVRWDRPFVLWGYTGSHSVVLFRSVKADPEPDTRVDLVFKPVDALQIRTYYPALTVEVAAEERARAVFDRLGEEPRDNKVFELVTPDGVRDHIVCLAAGWAEDHGEYHEPSPFAADLTDESGPPWRRRVLGGGPDGDLSARYASLEALAEALDRAGHRPQPGRAGLKGRFVHVAMIHTNDEHAPARSWALAAFVTREEAESFIRARTAEDRRTHTYRHEYWVQSAPIDL